MDALLLIRSKVGFRLAQHKTPRPLYSAHTHTTTRPPPPPPPPAFFHSSPPHLHSYLPPSPHGGSHAVLFTGAVLILLPLHMYTHTLHYPQFDPTKLHLLFFTSV
jgi:hypothetical protein